MMSSLEFENEWSLIFPNRSSFSLGRLISEGTDEEHGVSAFTPASNALNGFANQIQQGGGGGTPTGSLLQVKDIPKHYSGQNMIDGEIYI